MTDWLASMPETLRARIASGQISEAQVTMNTMRLHELLDRFRLDEEEAQQVEKLLAPPASFNPNVRVNQMHFQRYDLVRHLPQGSFLNLLLQDPLRASWVGPLLDAGFDISLFPDNRFVLAAARAMPANVFEHLAAHGADMNEADKDNCNAFFEAIDSGDAEKIRMLTRLGVNGLQQGDKRVARGYMRLTPYQYAVQFRSPHPTVDIVKTMLECGWGTLRFDTARNLLTDEALVPLPYAYHETMKDVAYYTDLRDFLFSQHEQASALAENPAAITTDHLRVFWSVGALDTVLDPGLWQHHKEQLLDLYLQMPLHIQEDMQQVAPLLTAKLAQTSHIHTPVKQWGRVEIATSPTRL